MPSFFDLAATIIRDKNLDEAFTKHALMLYNIHTTKLYKSMARW